MNDQNRTVLGVALASVLWVAVACAPEGNPPAPIDTDPIGRVTNGLRTELTVVGREPPATYTLAERMAEHHVPGVSIAVVDGGELAWARGYGVAEAGTGTGVSAQTLFQAASISKAVAATATLRLVQEGVLDLDTDVNAYLTSWQLPDNELTATDAVTLRRILSHSAGLTIWGFPGYPAGEPVPTVTQVLDGSGPANTSPVRVEAVPGSRWLYSGGGTTIQQLLVSDVVGKPYPDVLQELVLDPIGMTNSTYAQPLPVSLHGREAAAHDENGDPIAGKWHTYPEMAAAGLWTTPSDLMKWAKEIAAARAGRSERVLSEATATEMLTVHAGVNGLGPSLHGQGTAFRFGHGGANRGFRGQVYYFPETGQGAAVMSNASRGGALNYEILLAIGAVYDWPEFSIIEGLPMDEAELEPFVGTYSLSTPEIRMTFTSEGSRLFMTTAVGSDPIEVVFTGPGRVVNLRSGSTYAFEAAGSEGAPALHWQGLRLVREYAPSG